MQKLNIKNWAESDRPREKIIRMGRNSITNTELLAILIGSGTKNGTAVDLAKNILESCDNELNKLSRLSIIDLMKFKGIGQAKASLIFASMEIARRQGSEVQTKALKITSSKVAYDYSKAKFKDLKHEEFHVLLLNRANEIIGDRQISIGGLSGTTADGKLIFHNALELKSSAIILMHNHPSGQLKPSNADINLTKKMIEFGQCIDLPILDHLIFSDNGYFSFADEGLMINTK